MDYMYNYIDYIIAAAFIAFLGLKYVKTKETGHLWFLLPLLLVVGLNQGWGSHFGEGFFVFYRLMTLASCVLAFVMYRRDYQKRYAKEIVEQAEKRKQQQNQQKQTQAKRKKK